MGAFQFLSALPAVLGLTGFVVYYLLSRNRQGDQVVLDIIAKLRRESPDRLPKNADKLDSSTLANLIISDEKLQKKIGNQDFQLLRDALRHQFIRSLAVYSLCGLVFLAGIVIWVYLNIAPKPVVISSIAAQSTDPRAGELLVDLDNIDVKWSADGDAEDVRVLLENLNNQMRSKVKIVRSSEIKVMFERAEYFEILSERSPDGVNRLRVIVQTEKSVFHSDELKFYVGKKVTAVLFREEHRIRIAALIDNRAIDNYAFEASLLVDTKPTNGDRDVVKFGGEISPNQNNFMFDPNIRFDWPSAKLFYMGPEDRRLFRTELIGFNY